MSELNLVRLRPDSFAFGAWASKLRQPRGIVDTGFVWHALLSEVFGKDAPKPFVDRSSTGNFELIGYCACTPSIKTDDELALRAIGASRIECKSLESSWSSGSPLSFEVRARPTMQVRREQGKNGHAELDAAVAMRRFDPQLSRELAYESWLTNQLSREGAASLEKFQMSSFVRTNVTRRVGTPSGRQWRVVEGPDVWMRGQLRVEDKSAFWQMLGKGVGRHRAFGFGCLLVAKPGYFL